MTKEKFHCEECGGLAKAREEVCMTCDGEGNPKKAVKKPSKKKV